MNLEFDCVFYYVSNLDSAISFYSDTLGLRLVSRDAVGRFDIGGVLFELVPASRQPDPAGNGNARLCLKTCDINATLEELRSKGISPTAPEETDNGIHASFKDPDGNEICLWQYRST